MYSKLRGINDCRSSEELLLTAIWPYCCLQMCSFDVFSKKDLAWVKYLVLVKTAQFGSPRYISLLHFAGPFPIPNIPHLRDAVQKIGTSLITSSVSVSTVSKLPTFRSALQHFNGSAISYLNYLWNGITYWNYYTAWILFLSHAIPMVSDLGLSSTGSISRHLYEECFYEEFYIIRLLIVPCFLVIVPFYVITPECVV